MKKVAFLSLLLTVLFAPQFVLAGGGPAVKMQPLTVEQITNTNTENTAEEQGVGIEADAHAKDQKKSAMFKFFPEMSENQAISAGISVLALLGSIALVVGIAFFAYKYYRKTQEINRMLGIDTGKSDLDETKKTE